MRSKSSFFFFGPRPLQGSHGKVLITVEIILTFDPWLVPFHWSHGYQAGQRVRLVFLLLTIIFDPAHILRRHATLPRSKVTCCIWGADKTHHLQLECWLWPSASKTGWMMNGPRAPRVLGQDVHNRHASLRWLQHNLQAELCTAGPHFCWVFSVKPLYTVFGAYAAVLISQ